MAECKHEFVHYVISVVYSKEMCRHCKQIREEIELHQQLQAAEQQNTDLRADLAQREAEGVAYREVLEQFADRNKFKGAKSWDNAKKVVENTSSGKDMLDNMRVMRELIEAARSVCNLSECDYSYQFAERIIKLRETLAKIKGHKNEWGDY